MGFGSRMVRKGVGVGIGCKGNEQWGGIGGSGVAVKGLGVRWY